MHKWFILLMVAIFSASAVLAGTVSLGDVWLAPWTLADSKSEIGEVDDQALRTFQMNDISRTVNVEQTLKFEDPSFQSTGRLMWDPDEPDAFDNYRTTRPLRFDAGTPMFEIALDFLGGFESSIDPVTNGLKELEKKQVVILGKAYRVIRAEVNGNVGDMLLASALYEHEVNMGVHQVSLPSGIHNVEVANIDVVANTIDLVVDGTPINGFQVGGISSVLPEKIMLIEIINANRVHLGYGVNTIEFTDNNVFDNQFANGVYVDGVSIADGFVSMDMTSLPTGNVLVHSIKYRLHANNGAGGNVLVPGETNMAPFPSAEPLSDYIAEKEGMLHGGWDLNHNDITPYEESEIFFINQGWPIPGKDYVVLVSNKLGGLSYVPLVDNSNQFGLGFNLGNKRDNFYFVEPNSPCDFANPPLKEKDYFVITNPLIVPVVTDLSFLMQYFDVDLTTQEVTFLGWSSSSPGYFNEQFSVVTGVCASPVGHGLLANLYDFWIDLDPGSPTYLNLIVDYNTDGLINKGETNFILGPRINPLTGGTPWANSPSVAYLDFNLDNSGLMQQEPFVDAPLNSGVFIPSTSFLSPLVNAEEIHITIDEVVPGVVPGIFLDAFLASTSSPQVLNSINQNPADPRIKIGVTPFGASIRINDSFFGYSVNGSVIAENTNIQVFVPAEQQKGEILVDFTAMPVCDDGIDNDFDGLVDLADPDCNGNPLHSSELGGRACGDIDNDASVSILDVLLAAQHAAGQITLTGTDFACGDVDSDMDIDVFDTLVINQFVAGYATTLICTGCV